MANIMPAIRKPDRLLKKKAVLSFCLNEINAENIIAIIMYANPILVALVSTKLPMELITFEPIAISGLYSKWIELVVDIYCILFDYCLIED